MSFKKCIGITLILFTLFTLVSCSKLKVNEGPPAKVKPQASLGYDSRCLKDALPTMREFLKGTAQPQQVSDVWSCFDGALDLYYRKVKSEDPRGRSPREIATFFEEFFLAEGTRINDTLLGELMHMKQILVGGSESFFTQSELLELRKFAQEARLQSLEILPSMRVFSQNWKPSFSLPPDADFETFEKANQQAQAAAHWLGARIGRNQQDYEIQNFPRLLRELEKLYGENWSFISDIEEVLPLVHKLKGTLLGGRPTMVSAPEWEQFGLLLSRGYIQYLRMKLFIQDAPEGFLRRNFFWVARSTEDLLDYLEAMIQHKPSQKLTGTEIKEILSVSESIFPKLEVRPALIDELMQLKPTFLGGTFEAFLPSELMRAKKKVPDLRQWAEEFAESSDLYFFNWDWEKEGLSSDQALSTFSAAEKKLNGLAPRLAAFLEGGYPLERIALLAHELKLILPESSRWSQSTWDEDVARLRPLILQAKKIIANDDSTMISRAQWPAFLSQAAHLLSRGLAYDYFLKDRNLWNGVGLVSLDLFIRQTSDHILEILRSRARGDQKTGLIAYSELDRLLEAAGKANLLPEEISVQTLKPLVRIVMQKVLVEPSERLGRRPLAGLGFSQLRVLNSEWRIWFEGQTWVRSLYRDASSPKLSGARLVSLLDRLPSRPIFAQELKLNLRTPVPLTVDSRGRMTMNGSQSQLYSLDAMERLQWVRSLVRVALRAYGSNLDRIQNYQGLELVDLQTLYRDWKPLGVSIGLFDEENNTFPDSRFREANLFTPHADGSNLLGYREGVDLMMMILSGLEIKDRMEDHFIDECQVKKAAERRDWRVRPQCFVNIYLRYFSDEFSSLPRFVAASRGYTPEEKSRIALALLKASGWVDDESGWIRFGDLSLVPHVYQYIESTMARFDLDENGILDRPEALAAYPLYKLTLQSVANNDDDRFLKGVFSYILVKGKVPTTNAEKIEFLVKWIPAEKTWPIAADRKQLAHVLGFIADMMANGGPPQAHQARR